MHPHGGYPKLEDKKSHTPSWNNRFTEINFGENNNLKNIFVSKHTEIPYEEYKWCLNF